MFLKARSYHLGRWFVSHFTHPYPSKDQKDQLAARTNMTRNQVLTRGRGEGTGPGTDQGEGENMTWY